ncbi:MAG: AMP nucleosidase [Beijerinckiaceae bacterium]
MTKLVQFPVTPTAKPQFFTDPDQAVLALDALYADAVRHLTTSFTRFIKGERPTSRVRATYPYVAVTIPTHPAVDSRLSYGFLGQPGRYATTVTRPDIFRSYLTTQLAMIRDNHDIAIEVGYSDTPIPVHFAFPVGMHVEGAVAPDFDLWLKDSFDVPDLSVVDDAIVNSTPRTQQKEEPLAYFSAPRTDYSLQRLAHYTGTQPEHFQNFVLFTNYQFYIDAFIQHARKAMADKTPGYESFVEPGNIITQSGQLQGTGNPLPRLPQMSAYHLKAPNHAGITMVNIGVGPSNAKTITDHIAVLRPHAWLMLGHCAGLRGSQRLGDYVLAHAYVREDHVLDADLPVWVPIPALAEVQVALEEAVAEITQLPGYEVKTVMRTGTIVTIDNRNWELRDQAELVEKFSQSRAIALDMESATIAANGYRFRVPYGTLLCVSDKPLHGELKLPGMASAFYKKQVDQHLAIGLRTLEKLRALKPAQLHSRKLRSFSEVAFQ